MIQRPSWTTLCVCCRRHCWCPVSAMTRNGISPPCLANITWLCIWPALHATTMTIEKKLLIQSQISQPLLGKGSHSNPLALSGKLCVTTHIVTFDCPDVIFCKRYIYLWLLVPMEIISCPDRVYIKKKRKARLLLISLQCTRLISQTSQPMQHIKRSAATATPPNKRTTPIGSDCDTYDMQCTRQISQTCHSLAQY